MRTTDEAAKRILAGVSLLASRARAERTGAITLVQTAVLRHLARSGPLTPSELADRLKSQPQSLSRVFAALEDQGWIRRRPAPDDGRQSLLEVTPAGVEVFAAELRPRERWLAGALEQLTEAERDFLVVAAGLLERLAEDDDL
ncbi:DNA-binding MarR family transcriptional regulator [Kribbella voronezhensis]|uniref:DNA-binding MarR family transcriptional regulator n=1 Tax=Kribbella voronezhensis TaxID=2512212 RepID=A0A4R7T4P3_9ACTN|nr:MarR family transcriptional regulator [Kribbella voronezhensis]TDU86790.1 DNA-binding MarR family transcriptional regulator [Kribbella voronezhensis]